MAWQNIYFDIYGASRMLRALFWFVGLVLICFGILIIVIPELLRYLIGSALIFLGVVLLLGAGTRRAPTQRRPPYDRGPEEDVVDEWR